MFNRFIGVFFTGIVIKIMDDYLDYNIDKELELWNYTILLGRAALPYSLVLFMVGLSLNFSEGVGFFASSYCLGMNSSDKSRLPSGLLPWQEGLILVAISIFITDFYNTLYCFISIFYIQLMDDLIDYQKEKFTNQHNYIKKYGVINSSIIITIVIFCAIKFFLLKFVIFLLAASLIYIITYILQKWME